MDAKDSTANGATNARRYDFHYEFFLILLL